MRLLYSTWGNTRGTLWCIGPRCPCLLNGKSVHLQAFCLAYVENRDLEAASNGIPSNTHHITREQGASNLDILGLNLRLHRDRLLEATKNEPAPCETL